jgi:hypothetical protein
MIGNVAARATRSGTHNCARSSCCSFRPAFPCALVNFDKGHWRANIFRMALSAIVALVTERFRWSDPAILVLDATDGARDTRGIFFIRQSRSIKMSGSPARLAKGVPLTAP